MTIRYLSVLFAFLLGTLSFAQTDDIPVHTLSDGKYEEFFDSDSIEIIAGSIFNTRTQKVIGYVDETVQPGSSEVERFMTLDPLMKEFPHNSPYAFSENRVIDARELEGLEMILYTEFAKLLGYDKAKLRQTTVGTVLNRIVEHADGTAKAEAFLAEIQQRQENSWGENLLDDLSGGSFGTAEGLTVLFDRVLQGDAEATVDASTLLLELIVTRKVSINASKPNVKDFAPVQARAKYSAEVVMRDKKKTAGVYRVETTDGNIYIGESKHIGKRIKQHIRKKRFGKDAEIDNIQIKKHGRGKFEREILEQKWLDQEGGLKKNRKILNRKNPVKKGGIRERRAKASGLWEKTKLN